MPRKGNEVGSWATTDRAMVGSRGNRKEGIFKITWYLQTMAEVCILLTQQWEVIEEYFSLSSVYKVRKVETSEAVGE